MVMEILILKNATSNSKYTYIIYVENIDSPDSYTTLTISDRTKDMSVRVTPPSTPMSNGFWIAGCLAVEGNTFRFVPKNIYTLQDAKDDGRFMCHELFTGTKVPAPLP